MANSTDFIMRVKPAQFERLLAEVRACRICEAHLPNPPRPVLRASPTARVLIVGQAPGRRVHESGVPWNDPSGDLLREWLRIEREDFYDERRIAIVPAGLCYPGTGDSGDLPPRPECAPQWHPKLRAHLPAIRLTLLIASPYTRKVRIVLAEKKIDYDFEIDNPWKPDAKAAKLNPLGKVPALLLDDGRTLFDSRVIVGFLDNASPIARLVPAENRERVEARRWEALADGVLDAGVLARLENQREAKLRSAPWIEGQMGKVRAGLAAMDSELDDKPWCVGNGYSLADVAVGVCLGWLDFCYPKMDWKKSHANLARAFAKLSERQSFADTVPKE